MIPINKPVIFQDKIGEYSDILLPFKKIFPGFQITLTFSGRQALNIIYSNLYKSHGSMSVAVSPLTCFEALYPIIRNNHRICFVDINPDTLNMDERLIPEDSDIVQPIHLGGNPQNMENIRAITQKNEQIIVEDCAQAYGSEYDGALLGTFGTYSIFSLMKNLYALGGGLLLSKAQVDLPQYKPLGAIPTIYRRVKRYLESKNTYDSYFINAILYNLILRLRPENYDPIFASNTINKEIIRSIVVQLKHSEFLIDQRIQNAEYIKSKIQNRDFLPQTILPKGKMNYMRLFYIYERNDQKGIMKRLRQQGIAVNHITQDSINIYQESVFNNHLLMKYTKNCDLKNYQKIHDRIISFPISPNLSKKEMDYIINQVNCI